jgi:hypothetical protein
LGSWHGHHTSALGRNIQFRQALASVCVEYHHLVPRGSRYDHPGVDFRRSRDHKVIGRCRDTRFDLPNGEGSLNSGGLGTYVSPTLSSARQDRKGQGAGEHDDHQLSDRADRQRPSVSLGLELIVETWIEFHETLLSHAVESIIGSMTSATNSSP